MRWTLKLSAIGAAALAALTLGAAPARADSVNFSLQLGRFTPSYAQNYHNCYWQRFDRGRYDVVRQICRDRYGRTFVVPGSQQTIRDRDRRDWRRWDNGEWRHYRDVRDWDRDRRDWDRGRRDRDRFDRDRHDHDRGHRDRDRRDRHDRHDRDRDRGGRR